MRLDFPYWAENLFEPYRYKVLWGGRGSGKSYAVADVLLLLGASKPCRVLCAREFQNSLADSVLHLLSQRIEALGLAAFYEVQRETILGLNGTSFIFKGVRNNVQSIKSMSGLTHLWLEEAQTVSKESWAVLIPTIREPGSEIFVTFNPLKPDDPTYQMFVAESPGEDAYIAKVNWLDNPHWPAELEVERLRLKAKDPEMYQHVYEGGCLVHDESVIFNGKWEEGVRFPDDSWLGPYHGLDFGYALDPTAAVRCWISPDEAELYIDAEAGAIGLDLDDTAKFLKAKIPGIDKHSIIADSARPESIAHLARAKGPNGLNKEDYLPRIEGAIKGPGSVEDGLDHLKTYKIIVHPACPKTQEELLKYSYKVDRLTGEVLPIIVDKYNHFCDALRYSLEKVMKAKGSMLGILLKKR